MNYIELPTELEISEVNTGFSTFDTQSLSGGSTTEGSTIRRVNKLNSIVKKAGITDVTKKDLRTKKAMKQKQLDVNKAVSRHFKGVFGESLCNGEDCSCCNKLLSSLIARFSEAKTSREKYQILTCVPEFVGPTEMVRLFGCSSWRADKAHKLRAEFGAFSAPEFQVPKNKITPEVEMAVKKFYVDDANSRVIPGERNAIMAKDINGEKRRISKRLIYTSLKELFAEFVAINPDMKIGITKFSQLRPKYSAWLGPNGHHVTCVCVLHENFRVLRQVTVSTLKKAEFIQQFLCEDATSDCHLWFCSDCPKFHDMQEFVEENVTSDVQYQLWQTTDRAILEQISESSWEYWERLKAFSPKIASHHFIHAKQKAFLKKLKERREIEDKSVSCTVDFGMNYSFIGQNEPQFAHFGRPQCTVHPFVVQGINQGKLFQKSYVVVSDELNHNSSSFHVFRSKVISAISRDFPGCNKIYYVSDGNVLSGLFNGH